MSLEVKEAGNDAFRAERYVEAIRLFTQFIDKSDDSVEKAKALGNRSAAYAKVGNMLKSLQDAQDAVDLDMSYVKGHYRIATAFLALQIPDSAVSAAERGLLLDPKNKQMSALLAKARAAEREMHGDEEDDDDDEEMYDEDDDDDDDDDEMYDDGDEEEEEEGEEMPRGAAATSSAARASPKPPSPPVDPAARAEEHKEQGNREYKAGRYDAAVENYRAACKLAPEVPTYWINSAAALLMLQKASEALDETRRALELDPSLVKAHVRAAKCLLQLGRLSDARRQLEGARDLPGSEPSVSTELGALETAEGMLRHGKAALAQEGDVAAREAARQLGSLAERCPCSSAVACLHMEAVLRLRARQSAPQVLSETTRWMRSEPDQPDLLCVRGKALYRLGQVDQALKHFAKALALDPDHSASRQMRSKLKEFESVKNKGNEAFSAGKYAEAIERYTEAMELDPSNEDINLTLLTNRATAKFKSGEMEGCVDDCGKALDLNGRHTKAILRRAAAHLELEHYESAIEDYENALDIEPGDRGIKQSLHHAKIELKKSKRKDLYKVLGLTKRATDTEIKKAYRKMALMYHPDRHASSDDKGKAEAEVKFKELGEAFEILSDQKKKQQYDEGAEIAEINGSGGGGCGGMDPMDIFQMYAGMGGMPGGRGGGMPRGFSSGFGGF